MCDVENGLNVGVANIGEIFGLLGDKFKNLTIPKYQRPYRWTTQNVNELIDDILEAMSSKKTNYLLGNIILHKNENSLDIVDGQQRLTTLALILGFLIKPNDKFFDFKKNPNSENALSKNSNSIKNKLELSNKEEIANFVKNNLFVTYFMVDTIDEAFDVFDTQNSRGKELTQAELLKNHHFLHLKADEIIKQEIAKKYKYYQNKTTWSIVDSVLNDLYIARGIHGGKNFKLGDYISWGDEIFNEFIGIKDKGYERINELKFNSNIIKGNEYFSYLFKYAQIYEILANKANFSKKYYINQSMLILLLCYADKFGIDKNFSDFFDLVFVYLFATLSYYDKMQYNCKWLVNEGDYTILSRIYKFIESSDFSSLLIERIQNDIRDVFKFGNGDNSDYIRHPDIAYENLTEKTKDKMSKEFIEKISFKNIIFNKDKK